MKKLLLALCICLPLTACNLFNSNPLIGKWKTPEANVFGVHIASEEMEFTADEMIGSRGSMKIDKYEVKDKRVYVYPEAAKGQSIAYEFIDDNTITAMGMGKLMRVK